MVKPPLIPEGHATGKEDNHEFSHETPLPFLPQTWRSNDPFIFMWHHQLLPSGLCEGRHHLDPLQCRNCIVWAVLSITNPGISQALPCPVYFPFSGLSLALFCASRFPSDPPARRRVKRGCCRQQPGYRLRDSLRRTAQPHATAGAAEEPRPTGRCPRLRKHNALLRPAERGDAAPAGSMFGGEEGDGTRGRDTDCVAFVCQHVAGLLAWSFSVLTKDQGQPKYTLCFRVSELRWIFKLYPLAAVAENVL